MLLRTFLVLMHDFPKPKAEGGILKLFDAAAFRYSSAFENIVKPTNATCHAGNW